MSGETVGPLIGTVAPIIVALIAWMTKRSPEKRDPNEVLGESFETLAKRLADVEADSSRQWGEIRELRAQVDVLGSRLRRVVAYAVRLEHRVADLTGEPYERPHDVVDIFDDHH